MEHPYTHHSLQPSDKHLYIGTSIKQKVKGLAKCVRYDKVSLYQASFSYS